MDLALESQALRNRVELLGMDAESIGRLIRSAALKAVAMDFARQAGRDGVPEENDASRPENADFAYIDDAGQAGEAGNFGG